MLRWMTDSFTFLIWLCALQMARLVVLLLCIAEVLIVASLWIIAFIDWQMHDRPTYLLMPIGATLFVMIQVALWIEVKMS